jgi:hypothetical protein
MKIQYEDDFGSAVYIAYNKDAVPRIGESIIFDNEDYRVRDIIWLIEKDEVIVVITQNSIKPQKEDSESGRLAEVKNAIVTLTKQVATQTKKGKLLSEELVSVRTYLKSQKAQK